MSDGNSSTNEAESAADGESPLLSVHTESFAEWLNHVGVSIAVTTYQAGYTILLRPDEGVVNTHFRQFHRPMGLAFGGGRLALGAARELIEFRNMVDVAPQVPSHRQPDACYLPRRVHVTGDIDIHEMDYSSEGELWFVNTRFSCLCTLNEEHSFVPRWRPPFVTGLSPQDRCHLNGLAMVHGQPKYVTALGATDAASGWRPSKANGGVLIDVASGETVLQGLSMPHSPRWHNDQLWLLESGDGSIGTVDLATGRYEAVAKVNGFTRGVSFLGQYALIGISQVRESAVFSGIPITERLTDRICAVSLVDLQAGKEVGYVQFKGSVQEIFAVQILPHRFPELLEISSELLAQAFALPDECLPEVNWKPVSNHDARDGKTIQAE